MRQKDTGTPKKKTRRAAVHALPEVLYLQRVCADEQAGEQALCHRAQRLDEVALGGDDDVLAF